MASANVPFILTHAEYDRIVAEYDFLIEYEYVKVIDRDATHVLGTLKTGKHDTAETHDYYVLQDITNANLQGLRNAWFTTSGKILFVPQYGHCLTATIMATYEHKLEDSGWFHYSQGSWRNRHNVKITDRMYDALAMFAEQNGMDVASIAYGRSSNNGH